MFKTAINGTLVFVMFVASLAGIYKDVPAQTFLMSNITNKDVLPHSAGPTDITVCLIGSVITIGDLTHLYNSDITLFDRDTFMKDGTIVPSEAYV